MRITIALLSAVTVLLPPLLPRAAAQERIIIEQNIDRAETLRRLNEQNKTLQQTAPVKRDAVKPAAKPPINGANFLPTAREKRAPAAAPKRSLVPENRMPSD